MTIWKSPSSCRKVSPLTPRRSIVGRWLAPDHSEPPPDHVWPATILALPWVWYLSAYQHPLEPRSVGAILALYTLVTVSGCLAMGRVRWLASSEPFGIVLSWMALAPRRRLTDWHPPAGAEALLGVLAGGVLFGAVRRSELWGDLNVVPAAPVWAALGVGALAGQEQRLSLGREPRPIRPDELHRHREVAERGVDLRGEFGPRDPGGHVRPLSIIHRPNHDAPAEIGGDAERNPTELHLRQHDRSDQLTCPYGLPSFWRAQKKSLARYEFRRVGQQVAY